MLICEFVKTMFKLFHIRFQYVKFKNQM